MKKILIILFCFISFVASAQTYNPTTGTVSNKPYAPSQAIPTDSRSMYFDAVNFLWRPYQSPTEVLTYLSNAVPKYRAGNFIIIVDSGGTLNSNGTYTNFHATFYMFADGTADGNLVKLNLYGGSGGGSGITNITATNQSGLTWTITNPTTTPNLSIVTAAGGDVSGSLDNITVNKFNGQLPSYYQNYNNLFNQPTIPAQFNPIAGTNMSITGSYPNMTFSTSGIGFTTAGVDLKAISSSTVGIDTQNYRKQDTSYMISDSVMVITINSRPDTLSIRGGAHGSGGGTGSVTNVSVVTANGVSGVVANPTSTPAITLTLGAITPISVNGDTLAQISNGFTIKGGTGTSRTLTVNAGNATVSGTNTGDITYSGENYLSLSGQALTGAAVNVSGTNITGILKAASFPALTGDVTTSAGSLSTLIANQAVSNNKLANMPTLTIKGNNTGGPTAPLDLTGAQVVTFLPLFSTTTNGLVPSSTSITGKVLSDNGTWVVNGTGSTNTSVGGAFRFAINGTNNIKSAAAGYGVIIDSITSNVVTFTVDTTKIAVKGTDSVFIHNVGASGLGLGYTGADTLYLKKLVAGANITLTQNNDSSITITSTGGGASGILFIGAVNSQPPQANGAFISGDTLYLQYETPSVPGLLSTIAQTIAGAKTFSSAPTFSTLLNNGGIFWGNGSGTVQQTSSGTSTTVLHGGTSPSYSAVNQASDITGITPISNGGNGTATPSITAGTGISVIGAWGGYTINNTTLGTVTSVAASGGSTGLTFTGSPITISGTLTLGGTLGVPNGGTGANSLTPFAVLAGGSTSTGPVQQVSGLGTSGFVLTSNGAGSLPTWQAPGAGSIPTLDQVLTSGSTLTQAYNIAYSSHQLEFSGTVPVFFNNGAEISGLYLGSASVTGTPSAPTVGSTFFTGVNASGGNKVVNLPVTSAYLGSTGAVFAYKKTDASTNTVTINVTGGGTIDGSTSYVLSSQNQGAVFIVDGVNNNNYDVIATVNQSGGGGSGSLTVQRVTSGTSGTVTGGNYIYVIDPSSTIATYATTLPASPSDGQVVVMVFGGTLTSGTIVTNLTVLPNGSQHLIDNTPPGSATADNSLKYYYVNANTTWYRFKP